jgi:hypothetical protein
MSNQVVGEVLVVTPEKRPSANWLISCASGGSQPRFDSWSWERSTDYRRAAGNALLQARCALKEKSRRMFPKSCRHQKFARAFRPATRHDCEVDVSELLVVHEEGFDLL